MKPNGDDAETQVSERARLERVNFVQKQADNYQNIEPDRWTDSGTWATTLLK